MMMMMMMMMNAARRGDRAAQACLVHHASDPFAHSCRNCSRVLRTGVVLEAAAGAGPVCLAEMAQVYYYPLVIHMREAGQLFFFV